MKKRFKTNLTIDECRQKLNDKLFRFVSQGYYQDSYIGRIGKKRFKFYYHEANEKNRLNIAIKGKFSTENKDTVVTLNYASTLISLPYYIFYLILLSIFVVFPINGSSPDYILLLEAYIVLATASTIIGLISINLKKNTNRKIILEDFLKKELNLKEIK